LNTVQFDGPPVAIMRIWRMFRFGRLRSRATREGPDQWRISGLWWPSIARGSARPRHVSRLQCASGQRHRPRPPTTRSAKSAQSLHPGLRGWRELRRRRCHHGTCRKNFSARALCRYRSAGILAAPGQQQPTLVGARNSSTTCYACSVGLLLGRIEGMRSNWDEARGFEPS